MKQFTQTIFVLLLLTIVACTKDTFLDIDGNPSPHNPKNISFALSFGTSDSTITRGTPQPESAYYGTSSTPIVNILAYNKTSGAATYDFTANVFKEGGYWQYSPKYTWSQGTPSTPQTYNFYGYASDLEPITDARNANGLSIDFDLQEGITTNTPTITYSVPNDPDNNPWHVFRQPDLLVAVPALDKTFGGVTITMKHALSCISFVATAQADTESPKIKKILLKGVYSQASLKLDSIIGTNPAFPDEFDYSAWTDLQNVEGIIFEAGMNSDSTMNATLDNSNLNRLMKGDGYLMMVPQKADKAYIEVTYGTDISDDKTIIYNLPPMDWQPGKKYVYWIGEKGATLVSGVVAYYERYSNDKIGLYLYDNETLINTIEEGNPTIMDAGYGVFTLPPLPLDTIYFGLENTASLDPAPKNALDLLRPDGYPVVKSPDPNPDPDNTLRLKYFHSQLCYLYTLSQHNYPFSNNSGVFGAGDPTYYNQNSGIKPQPTDIAKTVIISFDKVTGTVGEKASNYCLPHYAKGVYTSYQEPKTVHEIRTPMQMRNISYQMYINDTVNYTMGAVYNQMFDLDFGYHEDRTVRGVDVGNGNYPFSIVASPMQAYVLNIGVNVHSWTNATGFQGTYNGKNKNIMNLAISYAPTSANNPEGSNRFALFESVDSKGVVRDLKLASGSSVKITTTQGDVYVIGGLVGFNRGQLINLSNAALVENKAQHASSRAGGVAAWNVKEPATSNVGIIENCTNRGEVKGVFRVGGIAAYNQGDGLIKNCTNNATITRLAHTGSSGTASSVGGIVGLMQCVGSANDTSTVATFPTVSHCTNNGDITYNPHSGSVHSGNFGGIVGFNEFNAVRYSGVMPPNGWGKILFCENKKDVSGISSTADGANGIGGIVGSNNGDIFNCQSMGLITGSGTISVGGIAGRLKGNVVDCMYYNSTTTSSSPISGGLFTGGIVGRLEPADSEWLTESGYINRCLFLAVAPQPSGGLLQPIVGHMGSEFLFRYFFGTNTTPNFNLSNGGRVTGSPFYTINNCFYLSGGTTNDGAVFEPDGGLVEMRGPFWNGRYPMGMNRVSNNDFGLLPYKGEWTTVGGWDMTGTYPRISGLSAPSVPDVGTASDTYLVYTIVKSITDGMSFDGTNYINPTTAGDIIISPTTSLTNTRRVDLYHIDSVPSSLTKITVDCTNITFNSFSTGGGNASLTIKAPKDWKFSSHTLYTGDDPATVSRDNLYFGDESTGFYVRVSNDVGSIRTVVMVPGTH